jgi:hypothetical protein
MSGPIGGVFMILSYFLFESYFLGVVAALVELPLNVLQALLGSAIAYLLYNLVHPLVAKSLE